MGEHGTLLEQVNLSPSVRESFPWVRELRREFHRHPELGFEEVWTQKRIEEELSRLGMEYREVAKTGLVSLLDTGASGQCAMVRTDIDALPVEEQNEHDYKSEHPGRMHACGHDAHMAIMLGTIRELKQSPPQKGVVKFIFQPGEEGFLGAKHMIEAGVMEEPKVDVVFGYHVWQPLPVGKIGIVPGPCMAAVDVFTVRIIGSSTHAAYPHGGVDPIYIAAQVISALQSIVSRNLNPLDRAVVTVGAINAGTAFNIIPEYAELKGTVRTFSPEARKLIPERFRAIVSGVAEALGGRAEIEYLQEIPATVNDPEVAAFVREVAEEIVGKENVVEPEPSMGGEDHAFYQEIAPGCYSFIGMANPEKGAIYPHHHPKFNLDEDALAIGVELISQVTRRWLNQH